VKTVLDMAGPQGARGEKGDRGDFSPSVKRAVISLFLLTFAIGAVNLMWTGYLVHRANDARCSAVVAMANIPVSSVNITPGARQFELALTYHFRQRARELGCIPS
jgi:hypothetical protein